MRQLLHVVFLRDAADDGCGGRVHWRPSRRPAGCTAADEDVAAVAARARHQGADRLSERRLHARQQQQGRRLNPHQRATASAAAARSDAAHAPAQPRLARRSTAQRSEASRSASW